MDNHTIPENRIVKQLSERYNPESIGQIENYPPDNEYYVSLYFEKSTFSMQNYYNVDICKGDMMETYDFVISNFAKSPHETMVTMKITPKE